MKNIVIPVDFSEHSRTAAKTGAYLARKTYARIHLLHVVYGPENWNQLTVENRQKHPDVEARIVEAGMKLDKLSQGPALQGLNVVTQVRSEERRVGKEWRSRWATDACKRIGRYDD